MIPERRKNPRFECPRLREGFVDFEEAQGVGRMMNFSRDGLALESSKYLRRNEDHKIRVKLSGLPGKSGIPCEVRIAWVRPRPNELGCICGAQIIRMDPSDKTDLLDILYEDWKHKVLNFVADSS